MPQEVAGWRAMRPSSDSSRLMASQHGCREVRLVGQQPSLERTIVYPELDDPFGGLEMPGLRWRILWPVSLVTICLVILCVFTAVSLFHQHATIAGVFQENVNSRKAAVELEECLTDLIALEHARVRPSPRSMPALALTSTRSGNWPTNRTSNSWRRE